MKEKLIKALNLQLFADGDGGASPEGEQTKPNGRENGFANQEEVIYGKQDFGQGQDPSLNDPTDDTDEFTSFKEKFKDRLTEERNKDIQDAIQRRFKNNADMESRLNDITEGLSPLFARYDLEYGDVDSLLEALSDDDSLFEDKAYDEGMSAEQFRRMKELELENQKYLLQQKQNEIRQKADADYNNWMKEAEELSQIYEGFNLQEEIQNPEFMQDLQNGRSMRKAYESAHLEEIVSGAIQRTAEQTKKNVVDNITARGMRPQENGSKSKSTVQVKDDVNKLTDRDIDQIIARAKRGEKISF